MEAAAELFAEVGYEAATLEAVAERVDLAQASIYHYVKNKEDLLVQILLDLLGRVEAALADVDPDEDPSLRLQALCRIQVGIICSGPAGRLLGRHEDLRARAVELAHTGGRYRRTIEDIVSDGIRSGIFRSVDLDVFTWTLMMALNATASWWTPEHPRSPEQLADEIFSYFADGLRPRDDATARGNRSARRRS